jgi:hypothetical protein
MSRSFDILTDSPASVEQLHAAFSREDYWLARHAAFDATSTLDSLIVDADGTVTVRAIQHLGRQLLPGWLPNSFPATSKSCTARRGDRSVTAGYAGRSASRLPWGWDRAVRKRGWCPRATAHNCGSPRQWRSKSRWWAANLRTLSEPIWLRTSLRSSASPRRGSPDTPKPALELSFVLTFLPSIVTVASAQVALTPVVHE